jgi:hypothetical protein
MIQLVLPSSSLSPPTTDVARAESSEVAAEAATGATIIDVAAREIAAFLSRFIFFSVHWN